MKYRDKIWSYFLLVTCGANAIIIIYTGQVLNKIATFALYLLVIFGALGAILTRNSNNIIY